jgi:deazaflavin-dependent oxidoreductase (nitroreductase family)
VTIRDGSGPAAWLDLCPDGQDKKVSRVVNARKQMATTSPVPRFVRVANVLTTTLLRSGVRLVGFGRHPTYLLTVRGRKSGQPRTTPVSVVEWEGKRHLFAPYGVVDWVRNLRAAGEAMLTRGRRAEAVRATELPHAEAGRVLEAFIASGNPMGRFFGVTATSSREEFERATTEHPVFLLERVPAPSDEAARAARPGQ